MDQRIKVADAVVKYGGQLIFKTFHKTISVREKIRHDYATEVKLEIGNLFDREIRKIFPENAI